MFYYLVILYYISTAKITISINRLPTSLLFLTQFVCKFSARIPDSDKFYAKSEKCIIFARITKTLKVLYGTSQFCKR